MGSLTFLFRAWIPIEVALTRSAIHLIAGSPCASLQPRGVASAAGTALAGVSNGRGPRRPWRAGGAWGGLAVTSSACTTAVTSSTATARSSVASMATASLRAILGEPVATLSTSTAASAGSVPTWAAIASVSTIAGTRRNVAAVASVEPRPGGHSSAIPPVAALLAVRACGRSICARRALRPIGAEGASTRRPSRTVRTLPGVVEQAVPTLSLSPILPRLRNEPAPVFIDSHWLAFPGEGEGVQFRSSGEPMDVARVAAVTGLLPARSNDTRAAHSSAPADVDVFVRNKSVLLGFQSVIAVNAPSKSNPPPTTASAAGSGSTTFATNHDSRHIHVRCREANICAMAPALAEKVLLRCHFKTTTSTAQDAPCNRQCRAGFDCHVRSVDLWSLDLNVNDC